MHFEVRKGADHPLARLTQEQAEAIHHRWLQSPRPTLRCLALEFNVARMTIYRVVHKITYQK